MAEIRILVVEPGKPPVEKKVPNEYETFREIVGGYIEHYEMPDGALLVMNEEGKLLNLPFNRCIFGDDGMLKDFIVGTFAVVASGEEDYTSLTPEMCEKYKKIFELGEER